MRFRDLKNNNKTKNIQKQTNRKAHYAKTSLRIKAFITDLFMIYAPILYVITYIFMGGKDEFQESNLAPFIGVSLYALIYSLLVGKFGQTPGKKAYDIKIVDAKTGQLLGFWRSLCRFVMFLFSAAILLGLMTQLYRKDNRTLHDLICGSVVIQDTKL
ncbi:RDD family protein [Sulfurimonas lithotrophica]|uniref:RDD family protein n=1 Tax=Sulfurimonas lithotrophica TaxID=2590022 RepID=A0A5P8P3I0_9BACT|nr:RDD family protein [Sulfurimonas lithotrophica]QFR50249.1 RDD family protein [Sulfurimonas lithotrophica]